MAMTGSIGSPGSQISFESPQSINLTMPANTYPNGQISFDGIAQNVCYWYNRGAYSPTSVDIFLCDSAGNNRYRLFTITLNASRGEWDTKTANISAPGLTGKALYLVAALASGTHPSSSVNAIQLRNGTSITVNTALLSHSITCVAGTGGTLTASASSATPGTTITLTPTASTGYQFSGYTSSPTVTISNNQFSMPASDITITASFTKISYSITKTASPSTGGTVTTNVNSATMGTTVTLSQSPATGYQFSGWTSSPAVTISNNQFTMPASNVSITATFTKISYSITKGTSPSGAGTVTTSANSATMGTSVTVSQTPAAGYYFNGWTTSPALTISGGAFTMPASNVSITAKYLRRSTATVNTTTATGGGTVTITISTESTAYSHKYRLNFGTNMDTGWVNVAAGTTSVTISVPIGWCSYVTSATTKTGGTLELQTYSGSTNIGSYTISSSMKFAVPASVVPTLSGISTAIARTIGGKTYANIGNYYVQSHSGVRIQATAAGAYSSSISSISISLSGYSGSNYAKTVSTSSIDFTTGLLTISGNVTITITTTDSRGRTATATRSITVTAYAAPTGSLSVRRVDSGGSDDPNGTYAKYTLSGNYSAVGTNALTKKLTSQGSTVTNPANSGDLVPGSRQTFNILQEYTITLVLQDSLETTTITAKVRSGRFIIHINSSGTKMGLMKAATKNIPSGKASIIEFSDDTQIYIGDVTLEQYIRNIVG